MALDLSFMQICTTWLCFKLMKCGTPDISSKYISRANPAQVGFAEQAAALKPGVAVVYTTYINAQLLYHLNNIQGSLTICSYQRKYEA